MNDAAPPAVLVSALSKWIDDRPILRDINLTVAAGEYVAILGANGAGKTTLLKILATLIPASDGELRLFGQTLTRSALSLRARVGLIGHQSMLYRDLSAAENLVFFAKLYGISRPAKRVRELLEMVGLSHRANDPVKDLSRGMTQRISIARALVHDPDLLLADEPFAGLDAPSGDGLERMLDSLHRAGKAIVLVNHDISQSLRLCQRAIVLRQGRIIIDRPSAEMTAQAVLAEVSQS